MKKLIIIVVLIIAVVAIAVQYNGLANKRKNLIAPETSALIPDAIPGWEIKDIPIASTPEMQRAVDSLLSFDTAIFRQYKKGSLEISVYIAYWLPAKVPASIVDAHTPDVCWVLNGWEMDTKPALPDQQTKSGSISVPNVRVFKNATDNLDVIYWHFSGGELRLNSDSILLGRSGFWKQIKWRIKQFFNLILSSPKDQFFIRVSSNKNIADVMETEPMQACLDLTVRIQNGSVSFQEKND